MNMKKEYSPEQLSFLRSQIRNELTEEIVYTHLAALEEAGHNRDLLLQIAESERSHAGRLGTLIGETGQPHRFQAWRNVFFAHLCGLTFGLKMMENGEGNAGQKYRLFGKDAPELLTIAKDEDGHEAALLDLLNDERLNYMGAIVLGLNDALIELTGTLAGFTFALSSSKLIAATGLITGLAAAMSMSASAFLSTEADVSAGSSDKHAGKTAIYTGIAYIITVAVLIAPYLIFANSRLAMAVMLASAVAIIAAFNFYLSVAKNTSFRKGFLRMACISMLVAAISFGIGFVANKTIGV